MEGDTQRKSLERIADLIENGYAGGDHTHDTLHQYLRTLERIAVALEEIAANITFQQTAQGPGHKGEHDI